MAVDAQVCLYQLLSNGPSGDSNQMDSGLLKLLYFRIVNILQAGIIPVFVFDGMVINDLKLVTEVESGIKLVENIH